MSGFAIKTAFQTKLCASFPVSGQSITADDVCFSVSQSRNMPCFTRKVARGRKREREKGRAGDSLSAKTLLFMKSLTHLQFHLDNR